MQRRRWRQPASSQGMVHPEPALIAWLIRGLLVASLESGSVSVPSLCFHGSSGMELLLRLVEVQVSSSAVGAVLPCYALRWIRWMLRRCART